MNFEGAVSSLGELGGSPVNTFKEMTKDERYQVAYARLLVQHPRIAHELDALSRQDADFIGLHFEDFRQLELSKHLRRQADIEGIDPVELVINLAARTESERKEMLLERHKEHAECLRIDWEKYCELNPHVRELF